MWNRLAVTWHPERLRRSPCTICSKPTYQKNNRVQKKRDKFNNNETRTGLVSGARLALAPALPCPPLANKPTNYQRGRASVCMALHVRSAMGCILSFSFNELRELGPDESVKSLWRQTGSTDVALESSGTGHGCSRERWVDDVVPGSPSASQ